MQRKRYESNFPADYAYKVWELWRMKVDKKNG